MNKWFFCTLIILLACVWIPTNVHASEIVVTGLEQTVTLNNTNPVSGASIVAADLGTDGVEELIIGAGMGSEPRVTVLRQDGTEIGTFLAYAPTLGTGINVTACDLTGDGMNEIIVAPQRGGGPHIRIFNHYGHAIDQGGFFSHNPLMREGINLACGNLSGDERAELVTLPAPGGGPHVRIWSWDGTSKLEKEFFAFHISDRSGLVGDVHNKQLYLAQQFTQTPTQKTFVIHNTPTATHTQLLTLDGLGIQSLIVHDNEVLTTTSGNSTGYNWTTQTPFSTTMPNTVMTRVGTVLIQTQGRTLFSEERDEKRILVDVSEQRLYAFEHGILRNSFLISSGRNNTTPLGTFTALAKVPLVHYAWNYGEGNPNNYDLGWIPYNIRFFPHIYIHYAPWHNNFGEPMSRGCVNVGLSDIQWIYEWSKEGIPVIIQS